MELRPGVLGRIFVYLTAYLFISPFSSLLNASNFSFCLHNLVFLETLRMANNYIYTLTKILRDDLKQEDTEIDNAINHGGIDFRSSDGQDSEWTEHLGL